MKRAAVISVLAGVCAAGLVAAGPVDRIEQSRAAVKEFAGQLKGELQAAMKSAGPVGAIEVCSQKAPRIAARISKDKGWKVGRTSLKVRNPDNRPQDWQRAVLERFEQRKASGEDPRKIEFSEVVTTGEEQQFRYMKAIPTGGLCLTCHGKDLPDAVAAKLDELYPNDQARGYQLGDIRGAFTIAQPM